MGRTTRNRELRSALKVAEGSAMKNVLNEAIDNTEKYNYIKDLGQAAGAMGPTAHNQVREDMAKLFIDQRPYLEDVGNRGLTTYGQQELGLQTDNAQAIAGDLRGARGDEGFKNAIEYLDGFSPTNQKVGRVNEKAQANALARAEIDAVKRYMNIDSDIEAIGVANQNRFENAEYGNVLLENSNYVRERLNQGDENLAARYGNNYRALAEGQANVSDFNTAGLGILRGGQKYIEDPGQPARMAGERVNDLVGAGSFADVYRDPEMPNVVRKEQPGVVEGYPGGTPMLFPNNAAAETEMQLIAAEKGIGPRVKYLERNSNGDTVIGMQDVSKNYRSLKDAEKELSPKQMATVLINHNLQLAELGNTPFTYGGQQFRGMEMADRHKDNVHLHNMNNRPIQLDFGMTAGSVGGGFQGTSLFNDPGNQAKVISDRASKAMIAAGLTDEGKILNDSVMLRLNEEDYEGALEAAQAGLGIAQRIKGPVQSTNVLAPPAFHERDGSLSAASTDNLLMDQQLYSRFS